jgi:hypothetical protein
MDEFRAAQKWQTRLFRGRRSDDVRGDGQADRLPKIKRPGSLAAAFAVAAHANLAETARPRIQGGIAEDPEDTGIDTERAFAFYSLTAGRRSGRAPEGFATVFLLYDRLGLGEQVLAQQNLEFAGVEPGGFEIPHAAPRG